MGKRKREKEKDEEYIRKKIRKLQEKLRETSRKSYSETDPGTTLPERESVPRLSHQSQTSSKSSRRQQTHPPPQPSPSRSSSPVSSSPRRLMPQENDLDLNAEPLDDELPEEFLLALGTEGQEQAEVGTPIRPELASRWKKIMDDGLGKEAREAIIKKYPTPGNFPAAVAPVINPEIFATLSVPSVKRDRRIVFRQNITGTLMSCLGKCLTSVLKGDINTKVLIEEISDAAKLAAEIYHHDSSSRKFFCLASANKTIQDAVRQQKPDKFLFGEDCAEKIKAAQTIQKTCNTIKNPTDKIEKKQPKQPASNKFKQGNWRGPPQYEQPHRARGGQRHHQQKHYTHRKDAHYKNKQRHRR